MNSKNLRQSSRLFVGALLLALLVGFTQVDICDARPTSRSISVSTRGGSTWRPPASAVKRHPQQSDPLFLNDISKPNIGEQNQQDVKEMMDAFLTRDSRNSFIVRVYAVLGCQLFVTAMAILLFGTSPGLTRWIVQGSGATVPVISLLISTVSWAIMCTSADARRKSPMKWQLLTIFTLGEAISVGFISSFYKLWSVLSAMMATTAATVAISLYTALQNNPKYDLSQWGASLSSCAMIFLFYGIIGILQTVGIFPAGFLPYNDAIYSIVGACLFSFYLAHHTKLITAGKHAKYQMNEKDYVFGAMTLYNDIINMFIYILRIIGEDKER